MSLLASTEVVVAVGVAAAEIADGEEAVALRRRRWPRRCRGSRRSASSCARRARRPRPARHLAALVVEQADLVAAHRAADGARARARARPGRASVTQAGLGRAVEVVEDRPERLHERGARLGRAAAPPPPSPSAASRCRTCAASRRQRATCAIDHRRHHQRRRDALALDGREHGLGLEVVHAARSCRRATA